MRRTLPRSEAIDDTVHLHGRDWPTLEHMFAPLASDVDFEIDMVFSWVDGSSDEFVRERAKRMQSYVVGEGDDSEARYRQIDELKYALRSVYLFAPWVRRIFIATDSPAPRGSAKHPGRSPSCAARRCSPTRRCCRRTTRTRSRASCTASRDSRSTSSTRTTTCSSDGR